MGKRPSKKMLENRLKNRLDILRKFKPFISDAFTKIERKCGNPNCRCAKGKDRHPAWLLTFKENKKNKSLYVPVDLVPEVEKWSKEAKWMKQMIQEVNKIQRQIIRQHVSEKRAASKGKKKVQKILEKL